MENWKQLSRSNDNAYVTIMTSAKVFEHSVAAAFTQFVCLYVDFYMCLFFRSCSSHFISNKCTIYEKSCKTFTKASNTHTQSHILFHINIKMALPWIDAGYGKRLFTKRRKINVLVRFLYKLYIAFCILNRDLVRYEIYA